MKLLILAGAMTVGTIGAGHAAVAGWGVPKPEKKPVSLREGSAKDKPLGSGRRGTRFLIGGGFRGGK